MKLLLPACLALALGMCLALPTTAQTRKIQVQVQKKLAQPLQPTLVPRTGQNNQMQLLENAGVQKDLKLSDEQVKKINELSQKNKDALKDLKGRELFTKMSEQAESTKNAVGEILNGDQSKRLKQLEVQQQGPQAFVNPQSNRELNITQEQTQKIRQIMQESSKKPSEIIKEAKGNREEIQKKTAELNKNIIGDIVKSLTPEQQKKWQEIAGEPFQGVLPAGGIFPGVIRPLPAPIDPKKLPPKRIQIL